MIEVSNVSENSFEQRNASEYSFEQRLQQVAALSFPDFASARLQCHVT
jgi:hypothetical protein